MLSPEDGNSGLSMMGDLPTATAVTRKELPYRLRQQSLLGEFGRSALQTRDIAPILQRATELCAQGLETRFAKVLEYMPDDKRLLVCAGLGWAYTVVRTPGTVQEDERQKSVVSRRFEGFIDTVDNVTTGMHVHKGEPLMRIYGPNLSSAAAEYLSALNARPTAGIIEASSEWVTIGA